MAGIHSREWAVSLQRLGLSLEKVRALEHKMERLGIKESDIVERFIRSSGPGGQNVNKVSTCVYLKHLPTGVEVKCQRERSQALNRFLARRILADKIEDMVLGRESEAQRRVEKLKRQKRKRSKRAKEKVLALKHLQAEKKKARTFRPDPSE
jgi:peptide chain release factor